LSQRFDQRVLELDARYEVASVIPVDAQIVGIVWVGSTLYLSTWHGKAGGCKIARTTAAQRNIEYLGSLPFAGISLAYDGERFWTNDHKGNALVTFTISD
jgi:glutamine cyclotransferase